MTGVKRVIIAAVITTAMVTGLSYALPERYAATGVGLAFLAATWFTVLRGDDALVPHFGLSLGGLLEARSIDPRRVATDGLKALAWAAGIAAVVFPLSGLAIASGGSPFTCSPGCRPRRIPTKSSDRSW